MSETTIAGIIVLYFLIGGVMGNIVMYVTDRDWREQPVATMIVSAVWPLFLIMMIISVGNAIGEGIVKAIRKSREKHSV